MELDNISHRQWQPVSTVSEVPAEMTNKILKTGLEVNAIEQSTQGLWELTCPYDWIWMLKYLGALIPGKN
jgi:hypothetical protein